MCLPGIPLTCSHSAFLWPQSHNFYFLLLQNVLVEVLLTFLIAPALSSSTFVLGLPETGSARHGGSIWQLLTEATPRSPLLPKPGHTKYNAAFCQVTPDLWSSYLRLRKTMSPWRSGACCSCQVILPIMPVFCCMTLKRSVKCCRHNSTLGPLCWMPMIPNAVR